MYKSSIVTYPVYLFETDTSGEKPYEEFYNEMTWWTGAPLWS